jgi:hypothetical protein
MRLAVVLFPLLLLPGIACNPNAGDPPSGKPNADTAAQKTPRSEGDAPTREAFLDYLDGKTIPLPDREIVPQERVKQHTIRKEQIEAVEFANFRSRFNDEESWARDVTFILNTGQERYALKGRVKSRWVEDKVAFLGFEVIRAVKQ